MGDTREIKVIGHIRSDFGTKFGIPRQAGLVEELRSYLVFEPEYRDENALRGLEGFSHIWVIWDFSKAHTEDWSPTVRPPRLGGNTRLGVFATRSPFRPNPIGLSCVRLTGIRKGKDGPMLELGGADMMDGTPVYDIKPYIPYADCRPEAAAGFTGEKQDEKLAVEIPKDAAEKLGEDLIPAVKGILREDPRPRYKEDQDRVYGMEFAGFDIGFEVRNGTARVVSVRKLTEIGEQDELR